MNRLSFSFLLFVGLCISLCLANNNSNEDEEEEEMLLVLCATMVAIAHHFRKLRNEGVRNDTIIRKRRDVESIMYELGPSYVKRYLRMDPKNFWKLVKVLRARIEYLRIQQRHKYYMDLQRHRRYRRHTRRDLQRRQRTRRRPKKRKPAPNGTIKTSVRVAAALRYMSGGDLKDYLHRG